MNPLVMRVIDAFGDNGDNKINFKMFIETLSVFSTKATQDEKLKCTHMACMRPFRVSSRSIVAFSIYDTSGDGYIDSDELYQVLKVMVRFVYLLLPTSQSHYVQVGSNLPDSQLKSICKNVIIEADEDGDGLLSYDEFADVLSACDIPTSLSINF